MARNMEFSYCRNQYLMWVTEYFLTLVNLLKLTLQMVCIPGKEARRFGHFPA